MRLRLFIIAMCLTAIVTGAVPPAYAGDVLFYLTSGYQYSLALGTVVSVSDTAIRFEVETIISGETLPSFIDVEIPDTFMEVESPSLRPGDYAVLSLDEGAALYTVAWGFFKVSSLNMPMLEIIDGTLGPAESAAFQWYLNSGGTEKDFYFVEENGYVKHSDGTSTQLYPPLDKPARVELSSASVGRTNLEAQAPSGTSERPIGNKGATIAPEWGYVLIAVTLLLAGCLIYGIIKTKHRVN